MTAVAIAKSAQQTSLLRYARSWGLWLVLLAGPIGARFMIARDNGDGIQIAVGRHLPVMTSAVLGVSLGIVVTTLLLPLGYIYLRSNTTRRQPWQVEEVTPASRMAIMLGRFAADIILLGGMLITLTLAGWFLGWFIITGPYNLWHITLSLWVVAAPALMGLAAIRLLFDAVPLLRRGWGDFLYFVLWMASIAMPATVIDQPSSFVSNLYDFPGFIRPLAAGGSEEEMAVSIGATDIEPGRVPLDVMKGLNAPGYMASRGAWAVISVLLVLFAGLIYRPHKSLAKAGRIGFFAKLIDSGPPPAVNRLANPAPRARLAWLNLIAAEARLIGAGRVFSILASGIALCGAFGDFRHMGGPAGLLLLIFGLTAHAGRSEARGLLTLTQTSAMSPVKRRLAFVAAGLCWSLGLALPAALVHWSIAPLVLAAMTGGGAALIAILLAMISGSAFAPRIILLIGWYGYLSS
jgi:hypothetical protein